MPFLKTLDDLLGSDPYVMEPKEVANMQDALREARTAIEGAPCGIDADEPGDCEYCNCWKVSILKKQRGDDG